MNLLKKREYLEKKELKNVRKINKKFENKLHKLKKSKNSKALKVIAITGSCGKSTTAVILHENLKALGYKSVLYSSAMVDSPASFLKKNEAYEIAVRNEEALLSIINEVEAYGADYLILEINESTIEKGFLDDVDFDVRVLTNLNPKHNLERYSEEKYVSLKKSFFENINDECKCVIGLQDYNKQLFEELLSLNNCEKFTFTSNYIANVKGVNPLDITCLLTELDSSLEGLSMRVVSDNEKYEFDTKVIARHNALNFVCVMTILKALNIFDLQTFQNCVKDIKIPGRSEIYNISGRYVVIEPHMAKMLETLKEYKNNGLIKKIKVVVGSMGYGYKNWDERLKTIEFRESRTKVRKYAMNLLKNYADFVYLTESDNASELALNICTELQNNLEGKVPSVIIENCEEAIKQAIMESEVGDVVLISGRGNRCVSCNSTLTIKLVKDSEVVEQVLKNYNQN